jgi:hypothetical protein
VFALISLDDEDLIARKIREPSKPSILRPEERIVYKILPGEFFSMQFWISWCRNMKPFPCEVFRSLSCIKVGVVRGTLYKKMIDRPSSLVTTACLALKS